MLFYMNFRRTTRFKIGAYTQVSIKNKSSVWAGFYFKSRQNTIQDNLKSLDYTNWYSDYCWKLNYLMLPFQQLSFLMYMLGSYFIFQISHLITPISSLGQIFNTFTKYDYFWKQNYLMVAFQKLSFLRSIRGSYFFKLLTK